MLSAFLDALATFAGLSWIFGSSALAGRALLRYISKREEVNHK